MIPALYVTLLVARDHLRPMFRVMKTSTHERLIWITDPSSKNLAKAGDFRLYLNGKPTPFYEPGPIDMPLGVFSIEQKGQTDAYLVSTRNSDGAIMAWEQSYLYWNGRKLRLVPKGAGDPLEFHPDGRLLVIGQFDSFSAVGINETMWESDRPAMVIQHGRTQQIGGAVNLWFEKDGSIRGISNGPGMSGGPTGRPSPHFFTYRNGVRHDEAVSKVPSKRKTKRLFTVKGMSSRY